MKKRHAQLKRVTKETRIEARLNIDGVGKSLITTGVPFFDHMLMLFAKHATMDLVLRCKGDLAVDAHHTVEDCGIALGAVFLKALGDKKGIRRYGAGFDSRNPFTSEAYVPMDECLARCVVDFSGRPYLVWRGLNDKAQRMLIVNIRFAIIVRLQSARRTARAFSSCRAGSRRSVRRSAARGFPSP